MKKEHLILLAVGVFLAYTIFYKKKPNESIVVLKPGDKGNDVSGLQNALTSMTGLKFSNMGAYDNDTLNAVRYYMKDTKALIDYDKGYVNQLFAQDLFLIQNKLKS